MVLVEREEGAANATAFFITPGGLAVTCAHVVAGAQKLSLLVEGQNKIRGARVCAVDEEADVALIAPYDHAGSASWFRLSPPASPRSLGTEVGVYGYPLGGIFGLSLTYSQGVINSLHQGTDKRILQLDAGAAPGSSGGPVFRRADGVVVGVLSSGLRNNPGGMLVNFAVDSERLWFNRWLEHLP
jgi:S1-C subfamily serine protease